MLSISILPVRRSRMELQVNAAGVEQTRHYEYVRMNATGVRETIRAGESEVGAWACCFGSADTPRLATMSQCDI